MNGKRIVVSLLVLLAVIWAPPPALAGGWASITVIELPQGVVVGVPVTIAFVVRQHGRHPMTDLAPVVRAALGAETLAVDAAASAQPGHYQATLIFPRAGEWTWQIEAFTMQVEMPPLTVAPPAARWRGRLGQMLTLLGIQPALPDPPFPAAYGRDLFIAKGCITCHTHRAVPGGWHGGPGGDLSHYDPNPELVRVWLRNAESFTADQQWPMPTLELTDEEIDALIAFLEEEAQ